jgi:F420H(2)-dependent quinone reductase
MVDYLRVADRAWPVLGRLMRVHTFLYRVTGGRVGGRLPGLPPMLLLDHVGANSGKRRTVPLVYMPDGEELVVVAAKGGHPHNPAWVHNLRAFPDTEVQVGSGRTKVRAREAIGDERQRLWSRAVDYNPLWGSYQRRTDRTVPLIILQPRSSAAHE